MVKRTRTPKTNPALAVAYLRVSTDEQSLGPDAQRAEIQRWAAARGVEIVAWHSDLGVSGGREHWDRPGLTEALAEMQACRAGLLLVAKRDRLARGVDVAAIIERTVAEQGGVIQSADGVGNGDDPDSLFMRRLQDILAERERWLIKIRTRAALAVKRARGERVGSVPFGFRLASDGVRLEADEAEQAVLGRLRELREAGVSIREIAARLNGEGRPARGARWHPTTVARVVGRVQA